MAGKRQKLTDWFDKLLDAKPRQVELVEGDVRVVAQFDPPPPAPEAAGRNALFTKDCAAMTRPPKPEHVLEFADVLADVVEGLGGSDALFEAKGFLMAGLGAQVRGVNAEQVVRQHLAHTGTETVDADAATDLKRRNGADRGQNATSYDFGIARTGGAPDKVELKLSRPTFDKSTRSWRLHFHNFKIELSDRVFLAVEAPDALHVFEWDKGAKPGLSTNGKSTSGSKIQVYAARDLTDLGAATAELLAKLTEKNTLLFRIDYTDERYCKLFTQNTKGGRVYANVPLGTLSVVSRGHALDRVAQAVLARWAEASIAPAPATQDLNGQAVGDLRTACDFLCDGARVEHKASVMCWNTCREGFVLQFEKIKPEHFDLLYLSVLTPRGIHLLAATNEQAAKHLTKPSKQGDCALHVRAPGGKRGYGHWEAAEAFLLKNLASKHPKSMGLNYVAFVGFAEGDEDRLMTAAAQRGPCAEEEEEEEEDAICNGGAALVDARGGEPRSWRHDLGGAAPGAAHGRR